MRCPVCRGSLALEEEADGRRRLHCLLCPYAREYPSERELRYRAELRALPPGSGLAGRPKGWRKNRELSAQPPLATT